MSGLPVRRFSEVRWLFGGVIVFFLMGTLLLVAGLWISVVRPQEEGDPLLSKAAVVALALQQPPGGGLALGGERLAVFAGEDLQWRAGAVPEQAYWPFPNRGAWEAAGSPVVAAGEWNGQELKVVFWPLGQGRLLKLFAQEQVPFARQWLVLTVVLALLLSLGGGGLAWFLLGRVLAPYGALLEEARAFAGKQGTVAEDRFLVSTFSQAVRRLEEQEQELAAKAQEFSEMAAGLAHELRNELSVVEGYLRLARENPGEAARYLSQIGQEVSLQRVFLERFLSFARPQELKLGRVSLSVLLEAVRLRLVAQFPGVSVEVEGQGEALADAQAIQVVVENLLRNACEAVASHLDGRVKVTITEHSRHVEVAVADNGPGVPGELGEKIFHPFVSDKPSGGIGLALARRLARACGGEVLLFSPSNPTVFLLRLRRWLEG